MEITFLTFNYGTAGKYVNGPGMCLVNLVKILERNIPGIKINIFSKLPCVDRRVELLDNLNEVRKAIERSDIVHHWSGLDKIFSALCLYAQRYRKKVIVGPNVLDTVDLEKERNYLSKRHYSKVITVNERLRYLINKEHKVPLSRLSTLMVGPDLELWKPSDVRTDEILWKGNSKQYVKDVNFGLEISKCLPQYKFNFIGHPKPYHYGSHIKRAKQAKLYICTSLSETMGLALIEQWTAGIPSVTHPNIYLHGENYKTGIITNRDVAAYCDAIEEIMESPRLYQRLSEGACEYVKKNFSDNIIITNYEGIIGESIIKNE